MKLSFNKSIVYYSLILFLFFQGHNFFLDYSKLNSNLLLKSYIFFYLFSIFLFISMYFRAKKKSQLSTIFFVGSSIKLILFFLIFRPLLYQNNFINKFEISIFLVPYIFSSAFVIYSLSELMANPN